MIVAASLFVVLRVRGTPSSVASSSPTPDQLISGVDGFNLLPGLHSKVAVHGQTISIHVTSSEHAPGINGWIDEPRRAVAVQATVGITPDSQGLAGIACLVGHGEAFGFVVEPSTGRWLIVKGRRQRPPIILTGGTSFTLHDPDPRVIRGECLTQEGTTRLELLADDQVIGAVEAPGGASFAGMALIGGSTGEPGARATFTNPTMTTIDEETPTVLDDPLAEQARMRAPHPVLLGDDGTKPGLFAESRTHRREFSYTGGEYRINVLESDSWWWWGHWLDHGSSDVTVAASARSEGSHTSDGRFGVLCIARPSVAYAFVVDPAMQEASVWKIRNDEKTLIGREPTPSISFGSVPDYIQGRCWSVGGTTHLAMDVNGYLALDVSDHGPTRFTGVGVLAWSSSGTLDSRFDNVVFGPTAG